MVTSDASLSNPCARARLVRVASEWDPEQDRENGGVAPRGDQRRGTPRRCEGQSEASCALGQDGGSVESIRIPGALCFDCNRVPQHAGIQDRAVARAQALECPDRHPPLSGGEGARDGSWRNDATSRYGRPSSLARSLIRARSQCDPPRPARLASPRIPRFEPGCGQPEASALRCWPARLTSNVPRVTRS